MKNKINTLVVIPISALELSLTGCAFVPLNQRCWKQPNRTKLDPTKVKEFADALHDL